MKTVKVRTLRAGEDVLVGVIRWDGNAVTADPPDDRTLEGILELDVPEPGSGRPLSVAADPEAWLAALHSQYRSPYLRAGQATGGDDA